jgi:hypothetical protein
MTKAGLVFPVLVYESDFATTYNICNDATSPDGPQKFYWRSTRYADYGIYRDSRSDAVDDATRVILARARERVRDLKQCLTRERAQLKLLCKRFSTKTP